MIEGLTPGQTQALTRINVGASALSFAGSFFIALCYVFFKDLRSFPFKLVFYLSLSVSVFGFALSLSIPPSSLPPSLPYRIAPGNIWKFWIDLEVSCRGCVPNKFCWEVLGTVVIALVSRLGFSVPELQIVALRKKGLGDQGGAQEGVGSKFLAADSTIGSHCDCRTCFAAYSTC
jgi:hypothetical protein